MSKPYVRFDLYWLNDDGTERIFAKDLIRTMKVQCERGIEKSMVQVKSTPRDTLPTAQGLSYLGMRSAINCQVLTSFKCKYHRAHLVKILHFGCGGLNASAMMFVAPWLIFAKPL